MATGNDPTRQNNSQPTSLTPPRAPNASWLIEQLALLAMALGEAISDGRLAIYADELSDLTCDQLAVAFRRARRECRFFPRIAELRELAGAASAERQRNAEALAAWDTVVAYVQKYVGNDPEGNYGPQFGWYRATWNRPATYPTLPQRLLDVIRRTGGWSAYALMGDTDFPFQQKRFVEAYLSWAETNAAVPALAATAGPALAAPIAPDVKRLVDALAANKSMRSTAPGAKAERPAQ